MPSSSSRSSTDAPATRAVRRPGRVVVGRVAGAHGTRGEVRVRYLAQEPTTLLRAQELLLGSGPDDRDVERFSVVEIRPGRPGEVLARLEGIASREAADALTGLLVLVPPETLPPAGPGEAYWYELVGCAVETTAGVPVGRVREVFDAGAHDVLVVEDAEAREILIPLVPELVPEVDVAGGRIRVEPLPGLLEPAR